MTLTLIGPAPDAITTTGTLEPPPTADGQTLLAVLRDMVAAWADLDPDLLHSTRPGGRAALRITAAARACADLGGNGGTLSTETPGIVVLRDLVQVLVLLERTIAPGAVLADPGTELPVELADAYATFLMTVGSQA